MERTNRNSTARASESDRGEGSGKVNGPLGRGTRGDGRELHAQTASSKGRGEGDSAAQNKDLEVEDLIEFTPEQILADMGMELNQNIEKRGKVFAWRVYQKRLMEYSGRLSAIMSGKEILESYWKIEADLKTETGGGQHGTPLDECREFLDGPKIKPKLGRPEKVM